MDLDVENKAYKMERREREGERRARPSRARYTSPGQWGPQSSQSYPDPLLQILQTWLVWNDPGKNFSENRTEICHKLPISSVLRHPPHSSSSALLLAETLSAVLAPHNHHCYMSVRAPKHNINFLFSTLSDIFFINQSKTIKNSTAFPWTAACENKFWKSFETFNLISLPIPLLRYGDKFFPPHWIPINTGLPKIQISSGSLRVKDQNSIALSENIYRTFNYFLTDFFK